MKFQSFAHGDLAEPSPQPDASDRVAPYSIRNEGSVPIETMHAIGSAYLQHSRSGQAPLFSGASFAVRRKFGSHVGQTNVAGAAIALSRIRRATRRIYL